MTRETFEREVLASEQLVIVDFWASWCLPCRAVSPVLDRIAAERADELKLVKVDVDEEPELAALFGVSTIPTIVLFRDGQPVSRVLGARGKRQLEQALGLSGRADERKGGARRGLVARLLRRSS